MMKRLTDGPHPRSPRIRLGLILLLTVAVLSAAAYLTTTAAQAPELPGNAKADAVLVEKAARRLTLLESGRVLKTYRVALGRDPLGPKQRQGDGKTPEGEFVLDWRNPNSRFHRSLHISYPSPDDLERGRHEGYDPGDSIMIHGLPNGLGWVGTHHLRIWGDWTNGCIAVTNDEIEEIWRAVPDGTPIEIRP